MRQRCQNKTRHDYERYGGRGITVCPAWKSFKQFLRDVGKRPSAQHELDRIDNMGNYEPNNVRWVTRIQNANNKRNNRFLSYKGRRLSVSEWERLLGTSGAIKRRIQRGWSIRRALTEPIEQDPTYTMNGVTLNLSQWARKTGISLSALNKRLKLGWSVERMLTEPLHLEFQRFPKSK